MSGEISEAQNNALGVIAMAYDDCAKMIDSFAGDAIAGLPDLTLRERELCKILLEQVAQAVRTKSTRAQSHLKLALSHKGSA
jgi:hypothetical protein